MILAQTTTAWGQVPLKNTAWGGDVTCPKEITMEGGSQVPGPELVLLTGLAVWPEWNSEPFYSHALHPHDGPNLSSLRSSPGQT